MKKNLFSFSLFILSLSQTITIFSLDALRVQADEWINQSLITPSNEIVVPVEDIKMVLTLWYLSYERSKATLESQEAAVATLNTLWQGWQNITQRRRNPSKKIPYPQSQKKYY